MLVTRIDINENNSNYRIYNQSNELQFIEMNINFDFCNTYLQHIVKKALINQGISPINKGGHQFC